MKNTDIPKLIKIPFAISGNKFDIPDNPPSNPSEENKNKAAYSSGFPDITMQPISAGGKPPDGQDFNGLFYDITRSVRWGNAGEFYKFDDDFVKSVGGYPKGALIINDKLDGFFLSSVDDNTENPNKVNPPKNWVEFNPGSDIEIVQETGNATDKVMNQKACTDILAKKKSQEEFIAGGISIIYGNPTFTFKTTLDNSYAIFELDPDKKVLKIDNRNSDDTLKNSVTFPTKSGTLALTSSTETFKAGRLNLESPTGDTIFNLGGTNSSSGSEFAYVRSSKRTQIHDVGAGTTLLFPQVSGTLGIQNSARKEANGYWRCGDTGILFQWGTIQRAGEITRVNFPVAYQNACFNVQLTINKWEAGSTSNISVGNFTKSYFEFRTQSGREGGVFWFAIGW